MKTRREMLEEFVAQDPDESFSRYALALELEKEGRELRRVTFTAEDSMRRRRPKIRGLAARCKKHSIRLIDGQVSERFPTGSC